MSNSSAVLPLFESGVVLVRRFRPLPQRFSLEIPRRTIQVGETPAQAATAAMRGSVGLNIDELTEIGFVHIDPQQDADGAHIFVAHIGLVNIAQIDGRATSIQAVSVEEFQRMILARDVTDTITICALNFARLRNLL